VRAIFALYLQHRSLKAVLAEIETRQWTTKGWITRDGKEHRGRPFTKTTLERLLKNVVYLGQVSQQQEVYAGEQAAIVEQAVWERANEKLAKEQKGGCAAAHSSRERKRIAAQQTAPTATCKRTERVPRITRLLALALKFEGLNGSGVVSNYAALAQVGQVSRARVTQMTGLLNLAPDIQEEILFLRPEEAEQFGISEPSLRKLTATLLWSQQREQWRNLRPLVSGTLHGVSMDGTPLCGNSIFRTQYKGLPDDARSNDSAGETCARPFEREPKIDLRAAIATLSLFRRALELIGIAAKGSGKRG
jgi:hypothetical protein